MAKRCSGGRFRISFAISWRNIGPRAALVAGAALAVDYILNVAVGIAAGMGALVSAVPSLLPYTLPLCLAALALLTIVNLRGVREAGVAFMLPTYGFVAFMAIVIAVGIAKTVITGGHPVPVEPPPALRAMSIGPSLWILARSFANGCTAMTGVEAVSNAVPIFRKPRIREAQRTLTLIIAILICLLAGVAVLCHAYGIGATEPGRDGYQSVLSILVAAVLGRGRRLVRRRRILQGSTTFVAVVAIAVTAPFSGNTAAISASPPPPQWVK